MAYTLGLGPSAERYKGSTPLSRTKIEVDVKTVIVVFIEGAQQVERILNH